MPRNRAHQRHLEHVGQRLLRPLDEEIAATPGHARPLMEGLWNLHGGLVSLGIRRFIYRLPTPEDATEVVARAVARFLGGLRQG